MSDCRFTKYPEALSHMYHYTGTVLCVCVIIVSGCIFSYQEPVKKPKITFVNLADGDIVTSRDITITWEGNNDAAFYQYSLNSVESEIIADNSVTFTDLDEQEHLFILKAFDDSLEVKSKSTVMHFTVDALQGPGILLFPRKVSDSSTLTISIVDTNGLMAAHVEIICEGRCASFGEFIPNESLTDIGEMITLIDSANQDRFIIDIAFAGVTDGLSGTTLTIGTLALNPLRAGLITIDSSNTIFRDTENESIQINDLDYVRVTD